MQVIAWITILFVAGWLAALLPLCSVHEGGTIKEQRKSEIWLIDPLKGR